MSLPTADQVRSHQAAHPFGGGGLWLVVYPQPEDAFGEALQPEIARLRVHGRAVEYRDEEISEWLPLKGLWAPSMERLLTWHPLAASGCPIDTIERSKP